MARWVHDTSRCDWNKFFDDQGRVDVRERSWMGVQFYNQFHVPPTVFQEMLDELSMVRGCANKPVNEESMWKVWQLVRYSCIGLLRTTKWRRVSSNSPCEQNTAFIAQKVRRVEAACNTRDAARD